MLLHGRSANFLNAPRNIGFMSIVMPISYVIPRTAGGLSHFRTAGGGRIPAPAQRTRKLRMIATSCKRCWIRRHKLYKKYSDQIFDQVKFEVTGVKKCQIFSKSGHFHRK